MAGKRKRNRPCRAAEDRPRKRVRADGAEPLGPGSLVGSPIFQHPVLSLFYPRVVTLRHFLLFRLPASSKVRRRRLVAIGSRPEERTSVCRSDRWREVAWEGHASCADQPLHCPEDQDRALASLLDTTLVCCPENYSPAQDQSRMKDLAAFSQQQQNSTAGSSLGGGSCSQSEVCGCFLGTGVASAVTRRLLIM